MDTRFLFAIVVVLLVYWLVRSRLTPHSQSGGEDDSEEHRNRRYSDQTFTGRQLQKAFERDDSEGVEDAGTALLRMSAEPLVTTGGSSGAATTRAAAFAAATGSLKTGAAATGGPAGEALEAEVTVANDDGRSFRPSSDKSDMQTEINRLTEQVRKRDRKLMRNRHAMEEVDKLNKKLFEKNRELEMLKQACARSDGALAHYRSGAQQAALLEQQLAEARTQLGTRDSELKKLRSQLEAQHSGIVSGRSLNKASSEHSVSPLVTAQAERKNQLSKQHLASELRGVETEAQQAQQNVLELRRIRSELESVRSGRANAQNRIAELQIRVREQQKALEKARDTTRPSAEISVLKRNLVDRQLQNEVLRQQLARLSDQPTGLPAGGSPDNRKSTTND